MNVARRCKLLKRKRDEIRKGASGKTAQNKMYPLFADAERGVLGWSSPISMDSMWRERIQYHTEPPGLCVAKEDINVWLCEAPYRPDTCAVKAALGHLLSHSIIASTSEQQQTCAERPGEAGLSCDGQVVSVIINDNASDGIRATRRNAGREKQHGRQHHVQTAEGDSEESPGPPWYAAKGIE